MSDMPTGKSNETPDKLQNDVKRGRLGNRGYRTCRGKTVRNPANIASQNPVVAASSSMTGRDAANERPATLIDPGQLARSFDAHAATLILFARQWLERAAAEDVVQDVFVSLMAQHRLPPDNFKAWLFKAVRNAAISHA